ncbi:MAG TPA: RepB family DNA primase, partial [Terriglobia bacterium]|nr:RepB family DNA primase [Terriglobia bacterium]
YKPSADSLNATPEMFLRTWDQAALSRSINWLRLQNLKGRNIYIRPRGEHPLTLLDDLTAEAIEKMKSEGFDPAVVVETSAGNFQAWVHHGEVLPKKLSTRAAKILANRFGGDPSSADWRHFGRLAGFTNRKDKYRDGRGLFPFVKLIDANGRVYPGAREFLSELRTACQLADRRLQAFPYRVASVHPHRLRTISDFRSKPEYQNDGNRVDLAYAIYALSHGISEDEVRATIASRDLSHKGNTQRQLDYVNRTVQKASVTVQDRSSER